MEEVNADREAHGKKPFDDDDEPPTPTKKRRDNTSKKKLARRKKEKKRTVTKSVTDPDSGLFVKGDHKRQFAYEAHTACDKHGFVLETVVTPGNVHDSVAFDDVYDRVTAAFPETETIVADSAYKTPHICKKVFEDGRVLSTAYKRPQTLKGGHEWWKYVYLSPTWYHGWIQSVNAMRQDAQKPVRKFCRSKEGKNSETHPEKPEKGETGCVPGAGEGCSRYGRVGKPEIRTKMHQIAMQHMKKGNRRKPSVFAGFLAGAEGLEPSARGFGVDVGKRTGGTGEGQCCPVSNASPGEDGAGLVLWEIFRAKTGEKEREIPEKT